ncbi:MAG TPA: hypothetical protein VGQ61_05925 [Candidatus Angelobacter sp.]|nr:hypothetical protein [Candidatus Angelobacter sp.]
MNEPLSTQRQVESVMAPLAGMPLWDAGRAADLLWLALGPRQTIKDFRGKPREVGEYALHVQCAWRFVQGETVVAGNRDLYYPRGYKDPKDEIPKEFNWDVQGANRCDEVLAELFAGGAKQYVVVRIQPGHAGELALLLEGDLTLQIFPNDSLEGEHWRLFRPGSDAPHWVYTGNGLERH